MKVCVIGCGNLGGALVRGLVDAEFDLAVCDRHEWKIADAVQQRLADIPHGEDVQPLVSDADMVVIAVKPAGVVPMVAKVAASAPKSALIVSCAAGVPLTALEPAAQGRAVVRAMPNTGASHGVSTTSLVRGTACKEEQLSMVEEVFDAVGTSQVLTGEEALHIATALAGSGPAFFLLVLEAMGDAGVLAGMPRAQALSLANGAMRAAVALVDEGDASPADLRAQITSPGGTTVAGLCAMEQAGARNAFLDAVHAAIDRSKAMSKAMQEDLD